MGVFYNPTIPSIASLIAGYAANNPKSRVTGYMKNITGDGNDIPVNGGTLTSGFLYLNDSSEYNASPDLSLNNYSQLSFFLSANCSSAEGDKKGHFFGYSQGSEYAVASTQVSSDAPNVNTTSSAVTVSGTATLPAASTMITSDAPNVNTTSSAVTVSGTATIPAASTRTTSDAPGVLDTLGTTSTSGTATLPAASTMITSDAPNVNTTIITGTQTSYYLPVNEIAFKFDRGSRSVYGRFKSSTADINITGSFEPSSSGDYFCVVYERTPFNKISLSINGSSYNTITSSQTMTSFPTDIKGLHYGSNGVGSDNFEGGMGSLYIYNYKLTTDEIASLIRSVR